MSDGFEPRIVVPDDTDAETVFAALVGYQCSLLARMSMAGVVDMDILHAARRAGELSLILGEEIQSEHVRNMVGGIPDDLSGIEDENRD